MWNYSKPLATEGAKNSPGWQFCLMKPATQLAEKKKKIQGMILKHAQNIKSL